MNEESYMSDRVEHQIDWYDRKSQKSQRAFKRLRAFEIIAAAAIPLIAGFGVGHIPVPLVVGVLGACIAVASAMIGLNQYQENWTAYRTNCESLRHEKFLFLTRAEPYHEEQPFRLFVRRVESLISAENSAWSQSTKSDSQKSAVAAGSRAE